MKITKLLLIIAPLLIWGHTKGQSFEQGSIIGSLGVGLGIYGGSSNVPDVGGTAATLVPVEFEYGLTDQFGLGITYQYGSYLTDDSVTNSGRTHNIGLMGYFHFANKDKSNLFLKAGIGYSNFRYKEQRIGGDVDVSAAGPWINFGFGWRHMIGGGPVGYFLYADYSIMPLSNFEDSNGLVWEYQNEKVRVTFHGVDIKVGLVVKIK